MNFPTIDRSFFAGECFDAYRVLGAHPCRDDFGQEGWRFAVWAPGAVAVEICGGFDGWGPGVPMQKADTGVWSGFVLGLAEGELYKYRIHGKDGSTVMRADPYAFSTELRPGTASRLARMDFAFDDSSWMERRDKYRNLPLNIYELHAGSWKHKPNATREDGSDGWYNYRELARELEGKEPINFPRETAMGALALYISDQSVVNFQPMNINFGLIPQLGYRVKGKRNKNAEISKRALEALGKLDLEP